MIDIRRLGRLELHNVILKNSGDRRAIVARDGNAVVLDRVNGKSERRELGEIEGVDELVEGS